MIQTAASWNLIVDRGPDWVFIRPQPPMGTDDTHGLAETVWNVIEQHFIYRVVLELDEIRLVNSTMIGQLVLLSKRIHAHGGVLRLCGVSDANSDVLRTCRLDTALPNFESRGDAVMGHRPVRPR